MIELTLHSTTLAACSTLTLTLAAAIALAQSPDQLEALVGGDPAGDDQQYPPIV